MVVFRDWRRQAQGGLKLAIKGRKRPGWSRFPPPCPTSHPPMNAGIGRGEAIAPMRERWSANRNFVSVKYR